MDGGEPHFAAPHSVGWLEGDFFCRRRLNGSVGALPEKPDLPRDDFGPITLARSVPGFVLAGGKSAFDVELSAFAQEPLTRVSQPSERDHAMPIGPSLARAVSIRETLRRRQRQVSHVLTGSQSTHYRVRSQIADHDHLVDCHCLYLHLVRKDHSVGQRGIVSAVQSGTISSMPPRAQILESLDHLIQGRDPALYPLAKLASEILGASPNGEIPQSSAKRL